jgi:hypothetical protein
MDATHSRPDDTCPLAHLDDGCCTFFDCTSALTEKYAPVPLCDRHVLYVWALVNPEVADASRVPRAAARDPRVGLIYYVRMGGYVKVGFAVDLRKRMMNYPPEAVLLAARPGDESEERREHEYLRPARAYGREWYHLAPLVLNRIQEVLAEHGEPAQPKRMRREMGRRHSRASRAA